MDVLQDLYRSKSAYDNAMQRYDDALTQWQLTPQSFYVDTRYGKTHVLRVGELSNPPYIFFHGWNGNAAGGNGELDIPRLAQYFCMYFPDTIGQSGKSAPTRPNTADSSFGDWIADIFTALEFERVYVGGISGGGYLSLKACAHNPDKVIKAFAMSSGGLVDLSRINWRFVLNAIPVLIGFEWGGRYFVRKMLSPDFDDESVIYHMGEEMRETLGALKPVNGPKALSDEELKNIQCPVSIIMGKYDTTVNPHETIERAERLMPNVRTQLIDAGHLMTLEKRDWLMDELLAFFDVEE